MVPLCLVVILCLFLHPLVGEKVHLNLNPVKDEGSGN